MIVSLNVELVKAAINLIKKAIHPQFSKEYIDAIEVSLVNATKLAQDGYECKDPKEVKKCKK